MSFKTSELSDIEVYETSRSGNRLSKLNLKNNTEANNIPTISLQPNIQFQEILGFGGAFTQASAYLYKQLSPKNQSMIMQDYFGEEGSNYSFTRTHMGSCDFSTENYSYSEVPNDIDLSHFSIKRDMDELIPMIKDAQDTSKSGFKIISSAWTAPTWMKDNNHLIDGRLKDEYREVWAKYFSKYTHAYKKEGIDIWGFTVINEPHGNGSNWESMLFTPKEMNTFVKNFLGPELANEGLGYIKILGYDQNRMELPLWVDEFYKDAPNEYIDGLAIHWYDSTDNSFTKELKYAHHQAPNKLLIQTEACIDSQIPSTNDDWYWQIDATDWGYHWRNEEMKYLHPKYAPVSRYTKDIINCMNNWVNGWIDWNLILDFDGGPNWAENWCGAPILVDVLSQTVYKTPIYYVLKHFSKYVLPGSYRIGFENDTDLLVTAFKNKDNSIVVIIFNENKNSSKFKLNLKNRFKEVTIDGESIQTIIFRDKND